MKIDIDDETAFSAWVSSKLDPITQNDPRKVAAYLVAALKKVKTEKDEEGLKNVLFRKLDAFVDDKTLLDLLCKEVVDAIGDDRYLEIREHPSFSAAVENDRSDLLDETDLSPRDCSRSSSGESSHRSGRRSADAQDFTEDSIEDRQPVRFERNIPESRPTVNSTISVLDDGKRQQPPNRQLGGPNRPICKDFTERGLCLRGNFCPYDHGIDPVVWQDARPMDSMRYNQPRVPVLPPQRHPGFPPMLPIMRPVMPPRFRQEPPPMPPFPRPKQMIRPRELIGIHGDPGYNMNEMFRGSDIQKRDGDPNANQNMGKRIATEEVSKNCSIEIRNVPHQLNSITALNAHFLKYGNIVNVQVRYMGDPAAALVTFQNSDAASRAFNSPEPVLNNRFINISWHKDQERQVFPTKTPTAPHAPPVSESILPENVKDTVAVGFTEGVSVRYPVGATRRARGATRRLTSARGRGAHTVATPSQPQSLTAHQRMVFLNLEIAKTEAELDKSQSRLTSLDEIITKITNSIASNQHTMEVYNQRLKGDLNPSKRAEMTELLAKMEQIIAQTQLELGKHQSERAIAFKTSWMLKRASHPKRLRKLSEFR